MRPRLRPRLVSLAPLLALAVAACGGDDGAAPDVDAGVYPPSADLTRDILDTGLDVDLASKTATATIQLAPSPSTGASFEVGDLTIMSVTSGGQPLMFSVADKQLDLGVPPTTAPYDVVITYAFKNHDSDDGFNASGFTLTWPYYCGNLFPCHSAPSDGTRFDLSVHGQASGTVVYPSTIPGDAPSYMAAWAIGDYTRVELGTTTAGTHVGFWVQPGEMAAAMTGTAHLKAAFDWLEQHIGPYTFGDTVGSVSVHWGRGAFGGMEHHPYWHIASDAMGDEATNVHEASHGWFGNGVRIKCWEDFVLSEGTARYFEGRLLEETGATEASQAAWASVDHELALWRSGSGGGVAWPQSCGQVDIIRDHLFSDVPYTKGAAFLRALEQKLGRPMFDATLHAFYMRYAGKAAGEADFLAVVKEVSGYDPMQCAQLWLINQAVPPTAPCP
ncbi:MAG TPA: M1 family aminopeptidase [Kofleriaceae bacterium]|nr:M1 family aminopeptidase [Kofleriaceae bacterium]